MPTTAHTASSKQSPAMYGAANLPNPIIPNGAPNRYAMAPPPNSAMPNAALAAPYARPSPAPSPMRPPNMMFHAAVSPPRSPRISAPHPKGMPASKPTSQAERNAREAALHSSATEDERRMRFLALLCGRGAFQTASRGGINGVPDTAAIMAENGVARMDRVGVGDESFTDANGALSHPHPSIQDLPPNYHPTTPQNLSRRILHRSGVGYLDDAVSLVLSALSDRFLATVLAQAMACRDRRLEGYKALIAERKARKRHRRRVWRERKRRKRAWTEQNSNRRKMAQNAAMAASDFEPRIGTMSASAGPSTLPPPKKKLKTSPSNMSKSNTTTTTPPPPLHDVHATTNNAHNQRPIYKLTDAERAKAHEYHKQQADIDAEEDYYHSYYGQMGEESDEEEGPKKNMAFNSFPGGAVARAKIDESKSSNGKEAESNDDDENDDDDDESDDDDDDNEEEEDEAHYDLLLRDLVRPLSAWGFDLTGKLGFDYGHNAGNGEEDDDIEEEEDEEEDTGAASGPDDDAPDPDEDEEDEEADNEGEEDGDLAIMSEEEGDPKAPPTPEKKSPPPTTKPKKGTKKPAKKTPAKRKLDKESDRTTPESKPKAKKAATTRRKKTTKKNSDIAATSDEKKSEEK